MLTDDDQTLRKKAVMKIQQLRAENGCKRGKEEEGAAVEKEEAVGEEDVEEEAEEEEGEGVDESSRDTFETMLSLDHFESQALARTKI